MTTACDLTDLINRPNPGANILGLGCLEGFTPASMYDPLRKDQHGQPVKPEQYNKGVFVLHCESRMPWANDPRFPPVTVKSAAIENAKIAAHAKDAAKRQVQADARIFYGLPIEWYGLGKKAQQQALTDATDPIAKAVHKHVGVFGVDCHNFTQVDEPTYEQSVTFRTQLARSYGKPIAFFWEMKWHPASRDTVRADEPIEESTALRRLRFLLSLKPDYFLLMGGAKTITDPATGKAKWTRLPMESFSALPAICALLTGAKK